MIFRQLFDLQTSTYTYLLADAQTREAILIDSVFEQHLRDLALLRELRLQLRTTLETHVHADHVTGAWLMKGATGARIAVARASGAEGADVYLEAGDSVTVGGVTLRARATPGHTDGCMTYVLSDQSMAFTGDALLIRGAGRTDFQQGDPSTLFRSVREQIFTLPAECSIYPGHDYSGRTMTTVAEERHHNPRLGEQVRETDFVGYMRHLQLPHPKKMADAVPANLVCGRPSDPDTAPRMPDWGPVARTFAGVWQVEPEWVHLHVGRLFLLDVREIDEVNAGPLGTIGDAALIPLSELRDRVDEVPGDEPVIAICPTGARSAQAAQIMERAGVLRVANLRGGILGWQALGYPLVD